MWSYSSCSTACGPGERVRSVVAESGECLVPCESANQSARRNSGLPVLALLEIRTEMLEILKNMLEILKKFLRKC